MPRVFNMIFAAAVIALAHTAAFAQPTAFTYQGRLDQGGQPYSGTADYRFRLFDAATGGNQVGATVDVPAVTVVNGLFDARVDFGQAPFTAARFLDISVRTPAWDGAGAEPPYFTFPERQAITPAPFALQTRGIVVDDAGNVGIGTDAPQAKLDVVGDTTVTGNFSVRGPFLDIALGDSIEDRVSIPGLLEVFDVVSFDPATQLISMAAGASFDGDVRFGGAFARIDLGDSAADQVRVSGDLTLGNQLNIGPGGAIEFGDGTVQSTAASNSGPPILTGSITVDEPLLIGGGDFRYLIDVDAADVGDVVAASSDITENFTNIRIRRAFVAAPGKVRIDVSYNVVVFDPPEITIKFVVFD